MELQCAASASEQYNMPLFAYIDHLRQVRERYGEDAARLELEFAMQIRAVKAEQQREAQRQRG